MASRWLIMKKSQKGLTLVEVLVSISVFTIIIFSLFSTLLAMRKVVARQEEYVKIEMVCQDINVYWEKYKGSADYQEWFKKYFNEDHPTETNGRYEYTIDDYCIVFRYTSEDYLPKLKISIINSENKFLVEDLEFPLERR